MDKNVNGQAAILIIFVIGMVGLLIGMTLSKTGFTESMMGRGTAGSTKAFYIANSGIEDAFFKIQKADEEGIDNIPSYELNVGIDGTASITISGTSQRREILSIGKYKNYVRKLYVTAFNTEFNPGFHHAIQANMGGVEIENTTRVIGDVYSNSYVKGVNRGQHADCHANSTTRINGNVWAVDKITFLEEGQRSGPCILGNAYTKNLDKCRVSDLAYYDTTNDCPHTTRCDVSIDPVNCSNSPVAEELPIIDTDLIKEYLFNNANHYNGDCNIDGTKEAVDCWDYNGEGIPTIGNIYIEGNLTSKVRDLDITGTIFVNGNIQIDNNQDIYPDSEESSYIILSAGKINVDSNVHFISGGTKFLLLASEYKNTTNPTCQNEDDVAIKISNNVSSILFYAINDCVLVGTGAAGGGFVGSVLGEGVKIKENTGITFDNSLELARFTLSEDGGWQITSFTEL